MYESRSVASISSRIKNNASHQYNSIMAFNEVAEDRGTNCSHKNSDNQETNLNPQVKINEQLNPHLYSKFKSWTEENNSFDQATTRYSTHGGSLFMWDKEAKMWKQKLLGCVNASIGNVSPLSTDST
ncbi:unnamed protein product [Thlaspi arvense]|uniref:Uncharacterized protein n=1 Tax=Thlaspi arvense TaxID=13288 RepID=A0AAU9RQM7_THLAR|nr:unnamed protein product [Thlaspi arvense]